MRASSTLLLLIIVAAISAGATYMLTNSEDNVPTDDGLSVASNPTVAAQLTRIAEGSAGVERFVTVEISVTTTPDPNIVVITLTPRGLETDTADDLESGSGGAAEVTAEAQTGPSVPAAALGDRPATVDESLFDASGRFTGTQEELPQGCLLHTIGEGEFPTLIVESYDLPPQTTFTMMLINGLTEETATNLQIGETLVIPFEGCPVDEFLEIQGITAETAAQETDEAGAEATSEVAATLAPGVTPSPTAPATVTLAPTVSGSTVRISSLIGEGQLSQEGVEIVNEGNTIDISGWTLSDGDGNEFIFPDQRRLFSGASVTVNTRQGANTAILFFWGLDEAVFESGDVVVLTDADGDVQSSMRVP